MQFEESFFQEEEREGFVISELMKRAWAAELEVLQVINEVCRKNGITYFAEAGTLLGAVRHQGFIPWDDDIDIALKRKDYNRLVEVLPDELPEGFVMTGMYADDVRLQEACDVQQIRVMADEKYWSFPSYLKRFHGFPFYRIGIDIFVLDYIPADKEMEKLQLDLIDCVISVITRWDIFKEKGVLESKIRHIEETYNISVRRDGTEKLQLWRFCDALMSMYGEDESEELTNFVFLFGNPSFRFRKEWYDSVVSLKFETIEIPAPIQFHEVLTAEYGDYKKPVRGEAIHDYPFYRTQEQALERILKNAGLNISITEFCRNWMNVVGKL